MRESTLSDIKKVENLLETAKTEPVGERLAAVLGQVKKECYNQAAVTTSKTILGRPDVYTKEDGTPSLRFKEMNMQTRTFTGRRVDIDDVGTTIAEPREGFDAGQLRWDAVASILNNMKYNCNEILDL